MGLWGLLGLVIALFLLATNVSKVSEIAQDMNIISQNDTSRINLDAGLEPAKTPITMPLWFLIIGGLVLWIFARI